MPAIFTTDDNPYAPPRATKEARNVAFSMLSKCPQFSLQPRVFEVGRDERHTIEVRMSIWTGQEVYLVDGQEQLRTCSWWGSRKLSVGKVETHEVEVRVAPSNHVRVFVDRYLVHDNLFPTLPLIPWAVVGGAAAFLALLLLSQFTFLVLRFLPV
jgi:hypothetical protein